MTGIQIVLLVFALVVLLAILELIRRRELREKYAILWFLLGAAMVNLAAFPDLLRWAADQLGIVEAANLLFFVAVLVLFLVIVHLSWELSRLERKTRRLAEEVAILALERQLWIEGKRASDEPSDGEDPAD